MEGGVVHHNHSVRRKGRKKLMFKPVFEQTAVHCAWEGKRRKDFFTKLGRNYSHTFILTPTDSGVDFLTSGSIPILAVQICVDSSFVHICDLLQCEPCDFRLIFFYLFWVLLPVMYRLFLRVICNRSNAFRMTVSQQPNSLAISFGYESGCSCTYVRSFSRSSFLYPPHDRRWCQCPFLFPLFFPCQDCTDWYFEYLVCFLQRMAFLSIFYCPFPIICWITHVFILTDTLIVFKCGDYIIFSLQFHNFQYLRGYGVDPK